MNGLLHGILREKVLWRVLCLERAKTAFRTKKTRKLKTKDDAESKLWLDKYDTPTDGQRRFIEDETRRKPDFDGKCTQFI